MQKTIWKPISCYGIGVHSGEKTQITLKPAPPETGIVFIRTDVTSVNNILHATYDHVFDTTLSTSISNDAQIRVATIEHLMAAIWGCTISNLIVELDGPEVPIMDGSSQPFIFMIECAGVKIQNAKQKNLKLLKEIRVTNGSSEIIATPSNSLSIDLTIDFASQVIGRQQQLFIAGSNFREDIANSRTFGFLHELDYLRNQGLAKGVSLDNTIGIDQERVLNPNGLRHQNEFVRHKLLDLLGDLFSAGGNFVGDIKGYKTSHALNNQFLQTLFSDPFAYQWIS